MTSTSITDFLISVSFLGAGGYALLARLRRVAERPIRATGTRRFRTVAAAEATARGRSVPADGLIARP